MDKTERDYFEWLQQRVIAQGVVVDALVTMLADGAPDRARFVRDLGAAIAEAGGRTYPDDVTVEGHLSHLRGLLHGKSSEG
jgi:hypothetical protein